MLHVQHSETEKTSTAKKRKSRIAAISVTLCQLLPKRRSWQDCPLIPFTSPRLPAFPLCSVAWHVAIAIVVCVTYTYYVYAKYGPLASWQAGCLPDLVGSLVLPVSLQLARSWVSVCILLACHFATRIVLHSSAASAPSAPAPVPATSMPFRFYFILFIFEAIVFLHKCRTIQN